MSTAQSIPDELRESRRSQWLGWMESIASDVKVWAESAGWLVHRNQKEMDEPGLGNYEAPVLQIKTPSGHLIVEPVALQVIGAQARIDLYAWPSLNRVKLVRIKDQWTVRTDSGIDWPKAWSRETFLELAQQLTSAA